MRTLLRIFFGLTTSFTLVGFGSCGQDYRVYSIGGVQAKFCVPKVHIVPDALLKLPGRSDSEGFAFAGCRYAPAGTQCTVLKSIIGGHTSPTTKFKGWRWQDFSTDAHIRALASMPDSMLQKESHGNIVVVSSKNDWLWYVWRKAKPLTEGAKPFLEDGDRLIAACQTQKVVIADHDVSEIACDRMTQGKDYALKYSFVSGTRVPLDVEALDSQVFSQIDSWRCER